MTLYVRQQKRHRYKEQTFELWEKAKVGWCERIALNMCITICEIDDQSKFDAWNRALTPWDNSEGWDGEGDGREVQDGGHMYTHGWFMSSYGKNHHNIVK